MLGSIKISKALGKGTADTTTSGHAWHNLLGLHRETHHDCLEGKTPVTLRALPPGLGAAMATLLKWSALFHGIGGSHSPAFFHKPTLPSKAMGHKEAGKHFIWLCSKSDGVVLGSLDGG